MRPLHLFILTLCLCTLLAGCGKPPKPTVNLYRAVHVGDLDQIKRHLFWGTEVNQPGPDGDFPLHVAVRQGRVAIARELLQHGAQTDVRDAIGRTPLHVALADGKIPSARLLLNDGADDDLQALLFALVQTESADRDTIEFLIQNGVNLDAVGPDGMAALHLAVASGAVQLAKRLITNGADVNVIDTTGNTPLSIAQTLPDPSRAAIMTELLQQFGATK